MVIENHKNVIRVIKYNVDKIGYFNDISSLIKTF